MISKPNVALRRRIECLSVWPGSICMDLSMKTVQEKEMIKSHRVRVNHELFTEWIISQLHAERCGAWRDENSALCWHHCSAITHWKSCYLQTIPQTLKVANSCCLCRLVSLSVSPCCLPPRSPGSLFVHLVTKYYLSLSVCHRQENVFLTWKKNLSQDDGLLRLHTDSNPVFLW